MELEQIAAAIRNARVQAGFTQKEVAEALDKGQTTVASWETGRSQPDATTIIALSNLFHVSSDYLLGISSFKDANSESLIRSMLGDASSELPQWSKDKLSQFSSDMLKFYNTLKELDIELLPLAMDALISILHILQELVDSYSKHRKIYEIYHASKGLISHFDILSPKLQQTLLEVDGFSDLLDNLSDFSALAQSSYPHEFANEAIAIIDRAQGALSGFALFLAGEFMPDNDTPDDSSQSTS